MFLCDQYKSKKDSVENRIKYRGKCLLMIMVLKLRACIPYDDLVLINMKVVDDDKVEACLKRFRASNVKVSKDLFK